MILAIRDETAAGGVVNELSLDILTEQISIRELIRSRVYQEVQDFNLRHDTNTPFKGLVTPTPSERTLNGEIHRNHKEIDWKEHFDKACEAFERNSVVILIDDRQAETLNETITLRHDTRVTFIKLTPLVGG